MVLGFIVCLFLHWPRMDPNSYNTLKKCLFLLLNVLEVERKKPNYYVHIYYIFMAVKLKRNGEISWHLKSNLFQQNVLNSLSGKNCSVFFFWRVFPLDGKKPYISLSLCLIIFIYFLSYSTYSFAPPTLNHKVVYKMDGWMNRRTCFC